MLVTKDICPLSWPRHSEKQDHIFVAQLLQVPLMLYGRDYSALGIRGAQVWIFLIILWCKMLMYVFEHFTPHTHKIDFFWFFLQFLYFHCLSGVHKSGHRIEILVWFQLFFLQPFYMHIWLTKSCASVLHIYRLDNNACIFWVYFGLLGDVLFSESRYSLQGTRDNFIDFKMLCRLSVLNVIIGVWYVGIRVCKYTVLGTLPFPVLVPTQSGCLLPRKV